MPTRDELVRHYAALADDRLMALALNAASELTAEANEVLKAELHARHLGDQAIKLYAMRFSPRELDAIVQRARRLPCPSCGSTAGLLNAATVETVRSYVVMTSHETSLVVGCCSCIKAAAGKADTVAWAWGWWGLKFGPVYAVFALLTNAKARSVSRQQDATVEFRTFVQEHRDAILIQLQAQQDSGSGGPDGPTSGCS